MPKLTVWMIRISLIHMGLGFFFGSLILHHKGIPIYPWTWKLLNPHIEIMIFGWTIQFTMGVTFAILPRFSERDNRYGAEYLGWWSFYLINAGTILTAFASWYALSLIAAIGQVFILLAIITFTVMILSRVKPLSRFTSNQKLKI